MRGRASARPVSGWRICARAPGKLSEALGVGLPLNGADLLAPPFEITDAEPAANEIEIVASPRIGITKAAELPWRYCAAGSRYVSRPWPPITARLA